MATVYVAFCKMHSVRNSSHVVAIAHDRATAEMFAKEHDEDRTLHAGHERHTEVQEMELSAPAEWHLTQAVGAYRTV